MEHETPGVHFQETPQQLKGMHILISHDWYMQCRYLSYELGGFTLGWFCGFFICTFSLPPQTSNCSYKTNKASGATMLTFQQEYLWKTGRKEGKTATLLALCHQSYQVTLEVVQCTAGGNSYFYITVYGYQCSFGVTALVCCRSNLEMLWHYTINTEYINRGFSICCQKETKLQ